MKLSGIMFKSKSQGIFQMKFLVEFDFKSLIKVTAFPVSVAWADRNIELPIDWILAI